MNLPFSFGGFTNKNEYKKMPFYLLRNDKCTLLEHKKILIYILENKTGSIKYTELFCMAFDYFIENYKEYDGTSGGEELDTIYRNGISYRYGISSIVHDYLDAIGFTFDKEGLRLSDDLLVVMTKALHSSSFNIEKRKLVALAAPYRLWKHRKKVKHNDPKMRLLVKELVGDYKRNFNKLLKIAMATVLLIIALVWKYGFTYIVEVIKSFF